VRARVALGAAARAARRPPPRARTRLARVPRPVPPLRTGRPRSRSYGAIEAFLAAFLVGDALALRVAPALALGGLALLTRCCATAGAKLSLVVATVQVHAAFAAAGRLVGAVAPSDGVANAGAAVFVLLALLVSGFFAAPAFAPAAWRAVATVAPPAAAGYEAIVAAEFAGVDDLFISSKLGASKIRAGPYAGDAVLDCFGLGGRGAARDAHLGLLLFEAVVDAVALAAVQVFRSKVYGF